MKHKQAYTALVLAVLLLISVGISAYVRMSNEAHDATEVHEVDVIEGSDVETAD